MEQFDPYRIWLGIPPREQPADHYRLLGIGRFESDKTVISNAADRQMMHVRSFQSGQYSRISQEILNELSGARLCLLDTRRKAEYDSQLRVREVASIPPPLPSVSVPRQSVPPQAPSVSAPPQSVTAPPRSVPPPPRSSVLPPPPSLVPPPPPDDASAGPIASGVPAPPLAADSSPAPSPEPTTGRVVSARERSASYKTRHRKSPLSGVLFTLFTLALGLGLVIWAISSASDDSGANSCDDGSSGNVTTTHELPRKSKDELPRKSEDTPADKPKKSERRKKRQNRGGRTSFLRRDTDDRIAESHDYRGPVDTFDLAAEGV